MDNFQGGERRNDILAGEQGRRLFILTERDTGETAAVLGGARRKENLSKSSGYVKKSTSFGDALI